MLRGAGNSSDLLAKDVVWHCPHPVGDLAGRDALEQGLLRQLRAAFPDIERREDIFIGGSFAGSQWFAATGYFFASFEKDFLGIPAHGGWAHLRFGEILRLEAGRVAEAFLMLDLVDLMRQAGVYPWRHGAGIETYVAGPATRDGVRLTQGSKSETQQTCDLVLTMLGSLFEPDRRSMGMERFWAPNMMWYGPGMIGTARGLDGFFRFHQDPWTRAFPDWHDALQAPFFADGSYACYAGWPSIRATHAGPLFGFPPTGRTIEIRVMDWWRRQGDLLAENWVLIDFPHLFLQLGVDLFARMRSPKTRAPSQNSAEG